MEESKRLFNCTEKCPPFLARLIFLDTEVIDNIIKSFSDSNVKFTFTTNIL